jgi:hypothetical protein
MNTIKKKEIKKEIEKLEGALKQYNRMTVKATNIIEDMGYKFVDIGTGRSAYCCSKDIEVKNITSKKYLNGEYLVIGICNTKYGKGVIYRGYVKEVVD